MREPRGTPPKTGSSTMAPASINELRDLFAAFAMAAIIISEDTNPVDIESTAYTIADRMMLARAQHG